MVQDFKRRSDTSALLGIVGGGPLLLGGALALAIVLPGCSLFSQSTKTTSEEQGSVLEATPPPSGEEARSMPSRDVDSAEDADESPLPPDTLGLHGEEALQAAFEDLESEDDAERLRALQLLTLVVEEEPDNQLAWYDKGVLEARLGRLKAAEASFQEVLRREPSKCVAWTNLTEVYRIQGNSARALRAAKEGLAHCPKDFGLLNAQAAAYREEGRFDESIDVVRGILRENAVNLDAFNNLGRTYIAMKDYEMAMLVFQKAMISVPEAKDNPYIHHNLALAYVGAEDPRAADEFKRAYGLDPKFADALAGHAYVLLKIQRYEDAKALLERAIEIDPRNVAAVINLGVAYRGLGRLDDAEKRYEEALRIDGRNEAALYNYGVLLGDYKREFSRAVEVYKQLAAVVRGTEREKDVERLVREATLNEEREKRRLERERRRKEEMMRRAAEEAAKESTPSPGGDEKPSAPTEDGSIDGESEGSREEIPSEENSGAVVSPAGEGASPSR